MNSMSTSFPRTIVIQPSDPAWPAEFQRLAADLRAALGETGVRIDHIGSTAVPGLAAKDIIDIQVTVLDLDDPAIIPAFASLGATLYAEITGDHVPSGHERTEEREWRKRYFRPPEHWRPTHLHVREAGRANQRYALLFRDYLRNAPMAASAYRQVKEALARLHPHDIDAYYDVKDTVCDLIMDAAARWARETAWGTGPSDA